VQGHRILHGSLSKKAEQSEVQKERRHSAQNSPFLNVSYIAGKATAPKDVLSENFATLY